MKTCALLSCLIGAMSENYLGQKKKKKKKRNPKKSKGKRKRR